MKVVIHQPNYIPGLTYFHKIATCDVFVFLDNVQYTKGNWINRNKIKTSSGEQWITVPVVTAGRLFQNISDVEIVRDQDWREKHWESVLLNYSRTPYFSKYASYFKEIYEHEWTLLSELNQHLIRLVTGFLGIGNIHFVKSSELNVAGKGTERLVNICKSVGANSYLSGSGGKRYMDESRFQQEKIELIHQDFTHPIYRQCYGPFIPNLSILDLLFNEGPKSLDILMGKTA